ncbi:phosphopyruvate hydratase, partial [[Eubacterium] cellulosolvens]
CRHQELIDLKMIKIDGTENKGKLGANAILGVSLATAKCASQALRLPLYRYLGGVKTSKLPIPMMNIINGGKHAGNDLALQEFLIMPVGAKNFKESLRYGSEIYQSLRSILKKSYGPSAINVGDEGGYAPPLKKSADVLRVIIEAIENSGYKPDRDIWIGVDAASGSYYDERKRVYSVDGTDYDRFGLIDYYKSLIIEFGIKSIEDPFYEEDFDSYSELTKSLGEKVLIVGDDLFVTNLRRLQKGIDNNSANALLLKVNQIGSLTEAIAAGELAFNNGWRVVVSHRSGETEDTFIADLAVGLGAVMIKTGAPSRGERTTKYNQLLRIEEELGKAAEFWGQRL